MKSTVHRDLLSRVDLEKVMSLGDGAARSQIFSVIQDLVGGLNTPLSGMERQQLAREVLNEVFGLGPLEPLLEDP
ncbi:MAG: pilus assembly protein CpaF, partial [Acidobacteria bacterium]